MSSSQPTDSASAFPPLFSDTPLEEPAEDALGYAPFAERIARSICRMAPSEGMVMAIYGPWGSGKTTLLNFIEKYITKEEEQSQPVIFSFNPWWFSSHEDLAKQFFSQILRTLGTDSRFKGLRDKLATYAEAIAESPIPYASAGKTISKLIKPQPKDVPTLKDEVAKAMRTSGAKVLVVIDDIDRLTSGEIRDVFRVIKAVANFPNTTYLLAFDQQVVTEALEDSQSRGKGAAYLEKIIQAPFELPLPSSTDLNSLFIERLTPVILDSPESLFDQARWPDLYLDGIRHFMRTARQVFRFTNILWVTLPAVVGEVNTTDFISLEALRLFFPAVWQKIRDNMEMFAGVTEQGRHNNNQEKLKQFHEGWLESVAANERDAVRDLVERLFPKVHTVRHNVIYGWESEKEWRVSRRVCSKDVFPVFFRLFVPEEDLSHSEMQNILMNTADATELKKRLLDLNEQKRSDGSTRAELFLVKLQDYTAHEIPISNIAPILSVLFDTGDALSANDHARRGFLTFGADTQIGRVVHQLLTRLPEPQRYELLRAEFERGMSLATMANRLVVFGQEQGKFGAQAESGENHTVTAAHLYTLEQIVAKRIREAARTGRLPRDNHLIELLWRWKDWGDPAEVQAFMLDFVKDDANLLCLIEGVLRSVSSQSVGSRNVSIQPRLDPESLRPLINPASIANRVEALASREDLTERQRTAVNQFLKESAWRQQGLDPSDPLFREPR